MNSQRLIGLVAAGLGTAIAVTVGAMVVHANAPGEQVLTVSERGIERETIGPPPDTTSPNWKSLSDDVGIMVRYDDRLGLRGRLYVRVDGAWWPVAADGVADVLGRLPAK